MKPRRLDDGPDDASAARISELAENFRNIGWVRSVLTGLPCDGNGEPIPWYTYPCLHFLSTRDLSQLTVFEYGSGQSTLWWANHARHVISCEHNRPWYEKMNVSIPDNVTYVHKELVRGGDYAKEVLRHGGALDLIVIDGRDRVNCARNVVKALSEKTVVLWDNSERSRYKSGYDLLQSHNFRRVDFHGFGPINTHPWTTSVFYRSENCLNL